MVTLLVLSASAHASADADQVTGVQRRPGRDWKRLGTRNSIRKACFLRRLQKQQDPSIPLIAVIDEILHREVGGVATIARHLHSHRHAKLPLELQEPIIVIPTSINHSSVCTVRRTRRRATYSPEIDGNEEKRIDEGKDEEKPGPPHPLDFATDPRKTLPQPRTCQS